MPTSHLIRAVVLACLLAVPVHAATLTFNNTSGNDFSTAANWSPGSVVPGAADTAVIPAGESCSLTTTQTVAALQMTGTLTGTAAGNITITGASTLGSAGVLGGGGITINFAAGSTLLINGTLNKNFENSTINIAGTFTFMDSGEIISNVPPTINLMNGGLFDIQNDSRIDPGIFNIQAGGVLRKSAGIGTSFIDNFMQLNNSGTVQVQSGTLEIMAGGTNNGAYTAAASTILRFSAATRTYLSGTTFTGAGTFDFSGSAVETFNANASIPIATIGGANFGNTGTGMVTFTTSLGMTIGTLGGTGGGITIPTGSTFTLSGTGTKTLSSNTTITIAGTCVYTGTGNITFGGAGATINISSGGLFDIQNNQTMSIGASMNIASGGTLRKTVAIGDSSFTSGSLNNNGTVSIQSGNLDIGTGGNATGAFAVSAGSTLAFTGGTQTFAAGTTFTGAGTYDFSAGVQNFNTNVSIPIATVSSTVGGTGTITFTSTLAMTAGSLGGSGGRVSIPTGATFTMLGTGAKTLGSGSNFDIAGTLNFTGTGNATFGGSGATVNVLSGGIFDIQNDQTFTPGAGVVISTGGTLRKSAGIATSTISGTVSNSGSLAVQTGILAISGGGLSNGAYSAALGTTLSFTGGTQTFVAGATFTGAGTYDFFAGTQTFNANVSIPIATLSSTLGGTGTITFTSTLAMTAGTLGGGGRVSIPSGATLTMMGTGAKTLGSGSNLDLAGTLNYTGTGSVTFGGSGTTVNVLNGGLFDLQNDQTFNPGAGVAISTGGTLRKSAGIGTSIVSGTTTNNGGSVLAQIGTLNFGSALNQASGTTSLAGGSLQGTVTLTGGVLTGAGSISGNVSNGGTLRPNGTNAAGAIAITGTFTQTASGTLEIELGGTNPGTTFDRVTATGAATLNGTLSLSLIMSFTPAPADTFSILTFASRSGTFATVNAGTTGEVALYNATNVTLAAAPANAVPTISSIAPSSVEAGGASFTLTVNGTGYIATSVVRLGGSDRTTTFVSATQLTATIAAADISAVGTAAITVFTPTPGGGTSAGSTLTITAPTGGGGGSPNPAPGITAIAPASVSAGSAAFTLTVTGTNFVAGSVVQIGGSNRATTLASATQLTASILASDVATAGSANITVFTGAPGGGTTSALALTITASGGAGVAPTITSSLVAVGAKNFPFTFVVQATGTSPITFSAAGLPAGLAIDAATGIISGTPTASGGFDVALTATNATGSSSKVLRITILTGAGTNKFPTFTSQPTATPNPALAGQPVNFAAATNDGDGDSVTISWDFGDGTQGAGAAVSHTYSAPGVFTATVTASDGISAAVATVTVAVNGVAPANPTAFVVQKGSLKFSFSAPNKDSLSLAGVLPIEAGEKIGGGTLDIVVGDLERSLTLSEKGSAGDKLNSFKLGVKTSGGNAAAAGNAKFVLTLKSQTLFADLADFGFDNGTVAKPGETVQVPFIITINGKSYLDLVSFQYTSTAGKSGSGKLLP